MSDKRRQFLEKVGQCFSADSEQRAAAEQLVESQLTEDEVKLARSYDNLSAFDRRPRWLMGVLCMVMILVWMAPAFTIVSRVSQITDVLSSVGDMQSVDVENDFYTTLVQSSYFSDLSEADLLLLFGDYKRSSESDRLKGLWESEPDNPGLYLEYVKAYRGDFESYPADMLTITERIDPENAVFPALQLAEMADACTKKVDPTGSKSRPSTSPVLRKHYAITDMRKHHEAMDLFYTVVKMPSFESHQRALLKRRLPLIQRDEQDWLTRLMPLGYLGTLTSHSLRYQKVINLIQAEAYRCEREKDAEALKRLIPAWQTFCRMQHADILTLVDGLVLRACIGGPCEDFAAAAKACGLEELEGGFVALGKQMDAEKEARVLRNESDRFSFSADIKASVLSQLSMEVVAKQVNDHNKLPAPNTGPDRRADHAFFNGVVAALACLMLVLSALVVWLRTFRRDHLLRTLGRRLSGTFAIRDWGAVFMYGVLLPIGIYWLVNGTDSLLSAQRYALLNVTGLGQPVSLLLMLLVAPVIAITYRLNHVLPVEQRKVSKRLWVAGILAVLAMPLFGLAGVFLSMPLVILGHSMQILACVLVLQVLIARTETIMLEIEKYSDIRKVLNVIVPINVVLWVGAAALTGDKFEHLFPTLSLIPGAVLCGFILRAQTLLKCVLVTVGSALVANIIWIIYDITFIDKTSHNMLPFELIATAIFSFVVGVLGVGLGRLRRSSSYTRDKKEGGGSLFRAVRSQLLVPLYVSASFVMALHVLVYHGIEKHWVAEDELWKLTGDVGAIGTFEGDVIRQLSDELDVLLEQIETDIPFDPVTK